MNIPKIYTGDSVIEKNYPYHTAGKIWIIPEVTLTKAPDGSLGISFSEIERIQCAIVNEICGNSKPLSGKEFEFLCDATDTKYSAVAKKFSVSNGNVSHWINAKAPISFERSIILKRWFWAKMFADKVTLVSWDIPKVVRFVDEDVFFSTLKDSAITNGITFAIKQAS